MRSGNVWNALKDESIRAPHTHALSRETDMLASMTHDQVIEHAKSLSSQTQGNQMAELDEAVQKAVAERENDLAKIEAKRMSHKTGGQNSSQVTKEHQELDNRLNLQRRQSEKRVKAAVIQAISQTRQKCAETALRNELESCSAQDLISRARLHGILAPEPLEDARARSDTSNHVSTADKGRAAQNEERELINQIVNAELGRHSICTKFRLLWRRLRLKETLVNGMRIQYRSLHTHVLSSTVTASFANEGPLGIKFEVCHGCIRITEIREGSQAASQKQLRTGLELRAINRVNVDSIVEQRSSILHLLRTASRPVRMTFVHSRIEEQACDLSTGKTHETFWDSDSEQSTLLVQAVSDDEVSTAGYSFESCTVHVENIPDSIGHDDIEAMFALFGRVVQTTVKHRPGTNSKSGLVTMFDKHGVNNILSSSPKYLREPTDEQAEQLQYIQTAPLEQADATSYNDIWLKAADRAAAFRASTEEQQHLRNEFTELAQTDDDIAIDRSRLPLAARHRAPVCERRRKIAALMRMCETAVDTLFSACDVNNNGVLDSAELRLLMVELTGTGSVSEHSLQFVINHVGVDQTETNGYRGSTKRIITKARLKPAIALWLYLQHEHDFMTVEFDAFDARVGADKEVDRTDVAWLMKRLNKDHFSPEGIPAAPAEVDWVMDKAQRSSANTSTIERASLRAAIALWYLCAHSRRRIDDIASTPQSHAGRMRRALAATLELHSHRVSHLMHTMYPMAQCKDESGQVSLQQRLSKADLKIILCTLVEKAACTESAVDRPEQVSVDLVECIMAMADLQGAEYFGQHEIEVALAVWLCTREIDADINDLLEKSFGSLSHLSSQSTGSNFAQSQEEHLDEKIKNLHKKSEEKLEQKRHGLEQQLQEMQQLMAALEMQEPELEETSQGEIGADAGGDETESADERQASRAQEQDTSVEDPASLQKESSSFAAKSTGERHAVAVKETALTLRKGEQQSQWRQQIRDILDELNGGISVSQAEVDWIVASSSIDGNAESVTISRVELLASLKLWFVHVSPLRVKPLKGCRALIPWLYCVVVGLGCTFFVASVSVSFSEEKTQQWLRNTMFTIMFNQLVAEPLKVLLFGPCLESSSISGQMTNLALKISDGDDEEAMSMPEDSTSVLGTPTLVKTMSNMAVLKSVEVRLRRKSIERAALPGRTEPESNRQGGRATATPGHTNRVDLDDETSANEAMLGVAATTQFMMVQDARLTQQEGAVLSQIAALRKQEQREMALLNKFQPQHKPQSPSASQAQAYAALNRVREKRTELEKRLVNIRIELKRGGDLAGVHGLYSDVDSSAQYEQHISHLRGLTSAKTMRRVRHSASRRNSALERPLERTSALERDESEREACKANATVHSEEPLVQNLEEPSPQISDRWRRARDFLSTRTRVTVRSEHPPTPSDHDDAATRQQFAYAEHSAGERLPRLTTEALAKMGMWRSSRNPNQLKVIVPFSPEYVQP